MSRREKRARLRALECLAYSSILSYLRAENDYDHKAETIIEHLRPLLHISPHRHLAELRRILNDEELERLVSLKHFGQSHLKEKWTEEEDEASSSSTGMRKKFKV